MNPTETPNAEALQKKIQIGRFECTPFTLGKAILLEVSHSPYIQTPLDENGKPVENYQPTLLEVAKTLWIFLKGDRPDAFDTVRDDAKFERNAWMLASEIDDITAVSKALAEVFARTNKSFADAGLESGGEKKDPTGPSAS